MKQLLSIAPGGPETLDLRESPDPVPGAGEVVVAMDFAALNFFDTLIIADRYQERPQRPFAPGGEGAGSIIAVGEGIPASVLGMKVQVWCGHGALTTRLCLPFERCVPIPEGVSDEAAATLAIAYGTTLHAYCDKARLQEGETVVVLGAAGGAGLAAVEIGKCLGARVIGVASSDEKRALAKEHGADLTLEADAESLKEAIRAATDGNGADVVYDAVGGELSEPAMRALAFGGRHLIIGFASGTVPALRWNLALVKGIDLLGVHWGVAAARNLAGHRAQMERLMAWVAEGRLTPHIDEIVPLEDAAEAIARIRDRKARGKILVDLAG
ncbi:MAG: NADPH:quinone oxidoreductase family protein [Hyphomicrobiaceae bacterium]|nr:NADPH:quinone oxidoreductase family protein [Hyphomicrobiaceae bacterium]